MPLPEKTLRELIAEAMADEVGLWLLIERVKAAFHIRGGPRLKRVTLECVKDLLATGDVVAGSYARDQKALVRWNMPIEDVINRISHEWDKLGRDPNIGDIVTFVSRDAHRT